MKYRKKRGRTPDFIPGVQAVREILLAGKVLVEELWVTERKRPDRIKEILHLAQERGIPVQVKKGPALDALIPDVVHQGVVALAEEFTYSDFNQIIQNALISPGQALILAADHITDEGNLGALIRVAVFFGAQGLILPKDRSARITPKVRKRSSGAYAHLSVSRVVNLGRALDRLKEKGFWIIGAAGEGPESIYQFDWNRDVVLALGKEDRGLSPSVLRRCDQLVGIPTKGPIDSLNVSVAAGIILSEIVRRRNQSSTTR